jgi:hypothetical protein
LSTERNPILEPFPEKHNWFPRSDAPEHAAYVKRTPGLFKEEYRGDAIVALCSKA